MSTVPSSTVSSSPSPSGPSVDSSHPHCPSTPDVVNWIDDHTPDQKPIIPVRRVSRHNGIPNPTPSARTYNSADELKKREHMTAIEAALSSAASPDDELAEGEELDIHYSRTAICNAPRALLWKHMINKIRAPPTVNNVCNLKSIKILCEGGDYIYRQLTIMGDSEDTVEVINEKVTWDEANESIRFELYQDEVKEGYVEIAITLDASGHVCLTATISWHFHPSPNLTRAAMLKWRSRLRQAMDGKCMMTVRGCEEEARQIQVERRRRNSMSQLKEEELDRLAIEKEKAERLEKKNQDQTAAISPSAANSAGTRPLSATSHPHIGMRSIQVAMKPE